MTLSEEALDGTKKVAKEEAISSLGQEEAKDNLMYPDISWEVEEMYFDKESESIQISGNLWGHGKQIGYFSPIIPVTPELLIELIEHSLKKLGKFKTVMEAIK